MMPFRRLASGQATYVWDYIDHNNSDFYEVRFFSQAVSVEAVRDSNDVHMIGAVAVTIDSRSLLGFDETAKAAV